MMHGPHNIKQEHILPKHPHNYQNPHIHTPTHYKTS